MKTILNVMAVMTGVVLLFATESETGISNIVGLSILAYEADKLNLFTDYKSKCHGENF